jgi:ubiquinone/menaquinone biosynthesis C-methylase UbiE
MSSLRTPVYSYLPDPDGALAEAHRVLEPGGDLVIFVPLARRCRFIVFYSCAVAADHRSSAYVPMRPEYFGDLERLIFGT